MKSFNSSKSEAASWEYDNRASYYKERSDEH